MSDPKHPRPNDQVFDLSDLQLVDITPDRIAELSKLRQGHEIAVESVVSATPAVLKRAGISADEVQDLATAFAVIQRIDEVLPAVEKLVELLRETRLVRGHDVATRLGEMAQQVKRRADRAADGHEIAAPFEALSTYQSAPAVKAAATKEKAKAKEETPSPIAAPPV
jgi:hypothetical protein